MPVLEHKVMINRSVSDVYRFVMDFSNNPKWQPAGMQLERAGKVKLGDMIVGMQRMAGRMVHVNADVIDVNPNQKLVYKGVMGGYPFQTTYSFNFSGAGGTEVGMSVNIRIPWFYFFLRPFVTSSISSQVTTSMNNLKEFMESRRDLS